MYFSLFIVIFHKVLCHLNKYLIYKHISFSYIILTSVKFSFSFTSFTRIFFYSYKPWYLEECSSTLATTYSSGTPGHDKSIATVDMDGKLRPDHICTVEHTGKRIIINFMFFL